MPSISMPAVRTSALRLRDALAAVTLTGTLQNIGPAFAGMVPSSRRTS
ncbi:hypothetical protein AB0442_36575 [Kitasatospora sp. NPDC085895]